MKKKIHLKKKKKRRYILIILIILIVISMASIKIKKNTKSYAIAQTKKIISQSITDTIAKIVIDDNIFKIERNNDEIISINLDNEKTNSIITNINKNIQIKLDSMENTIVFQMPLFAPTNNVFFSSLGPKIPIKFKTIGNIINNLRTEVKNYGINNAVITTIADIKIEINVILPLSIDNIEINQTITLATKIIQGKIPNYYIPLKNSF